MKTYPKMMLGDAIMAVLKGEINQASRFNEEEDELTIKKNGAGNLEVWIRKSGDNIIYQKKAVLHERDAEMLWDVDYGSDLQPFEAITVHFSRLQGGAAFADTSVFRKTTWSNVKKELENRGDFIEFISVIGLNDNKVTILVGESAE